jgi:hypothetical protein
VNPDGDSDDPYEEEVDDVGFESVDRFLDSQRRLLDDLFEFEDDLSAVGSAALEDEPDELDA